jgi:hypothetical protein
LILPSLFLLGAIPVSIPTNRSQLMKRLGAVQKNSVWSWCAVDESGKKVYLSGWTDVRKQGDDGRVSYLIQAPDWGVDEETGDRSPARSDHDEKLRLVFDEGYEPYVYINEAKDPNASPREIANTKTSFIFKMELERLPDGAVRGYLLDRIEIR